jgi:hypothetical protein
LYDFNARTYDAQIGRFLQIDPEIENDHFNYTPYAFTYNNPISFCDPEGRDTLPSGKHIYDKGADEEIAQLNMDNLGGCDVGHRLVGTALLIRSTIVNVCFSRRKAGGWRFRNGKSG